jgi:DNA-binding response OmpR family regulator
VPTVVSSTLPDARASGREWVVVVGDRAAPLATALASEGFAVRAPALSPEDVRDVWIGEAVAAIADVASPLAPFLERWRRHGDRPVLFVADPGDLARLVELRRAGDDFVLRSTGAGEVAFRLRAALAASERVTLVLDHDSRHAVVGQRRIALTRLEFAVLAHLADHPGQAFTRDDLLQAVWGSRSDWQQPSTVTEHVRRVRTKLDADAPDRWIRTVHGVGYVFVG